MKRQTTALIGAISLGASALGGGTLLACNKSPEAAEKKAETKAAPTEEKKKSSKPAPPPVDEGIDVPTEEDFEETATAQITETSDLQKALDQLEKEIGK